MGYSWKYQNDKEIVTVQLTKEEAEVVADCLLHRRTKLEDCELTDTYCYPKLTSVYYKIEHALYKPDPLKVLICACRQLHKGCNDCPLAEDSVDCFYNANHANSDAVKKVKELYK